jgi:hypothetical protein
LVSLWVFFNWLAQAGLVRENPVTGVNRVAVSTRLAPKWRTRKEQADLIHVSRKIRGTWTGGTMADADLQANHVRHLGG